MASKRKFKKHLNEMVYDIVEECFYLQLTDESKIKKSDKLIDEAAEFQDEILSKIANGKSKKEFSEISIQVNEKAKYFVQKLNELNK
tara:strand:- start:490 stop:750 length:261 start_codon:yes stop_codon:yes gene_type:complete